MPVFKAFSVISDGKGLLYVSLRNGIPSGELYLEDLGTGQRKRIGSQIILSAAISPANDDQVAYTFSNGRTFGLALKDVGSGKIEILVERDVSAEIIQWDESGLGVHYYK